ncbi:MAG: osmotically-inducible protein OsmY [Pirellulaceae bacterium]|jgi:osmotically-inducible protein OsmY
MSITANASFSRMSIDDTATSWMILKEIRHRLQASSFCAIRELHCEFQDGVAILHGRVPTIHTRQVARAVVRSVDGVRRLDDCIRVDWLN